MAESEERPVEKIKRLQEGGKRHGAEVSTDPEATWPAGEKHVPPFKKGTSPRIETWKPGSGSFAQEPEKPKPRPTELPKVPPFVEEE